MPIRDDWDRFDLQVLGFKDQTEVQATAFKKKLAFQILEGVVNMTPVDTGRARGNWQVTLGDVPADGELPPNKSGTRTIQRGGAQIHQVELGESLWIHNNLPYIGVLERGHSEQAPQGMLMVTLANVESQFT